MNYKTGFPDLTRWFQVMGIPRWRGHCLTACHSNIVPLNIKLFTKYLRRHPSKHSHQKTTWKAFQMPPRAIKHQLTCPIELTSGSFLIGRRSILVIPRNRLVIRAMFTLYWRGFCSGTVWTRLPKLPRFNPDHITIALSNPNCSQLLRQFTNEQFRCNFQTIMYSE